MLTPSEFLFYEFKEESDPPVLSSEIPHKMFTFNQGKIKTAFYSQSFAEIISVCEDGSLYKIPIKAEKREDIEPEEDEKRVTRTTQVIAPSVHLVGYHHMSKIVMCEEIQASNKIISVSEKGLILIHDLEKREEISRLVIDATITCAELNSLGNLLFVGSSLGCLRVVDVTDTAQPRLVFCKKLHSRKGMIRLRVSFDNSMLCFLVENSDK